MVVNVDDVTSHINAQIIRMDSNKHILAACRAESGDPPETGMGRWKGRIFSDSFLHYQRFAIDFIRVFPDIDQPRQKQRARRFSATNAWPIVGRSRAH
jgi:hypothetical protein